MDGSNLGRVAVLQPLPILIPCSFARVWVRSSNYGNRARAGGVGDRPWRITIERLAFRDLSRPRPIPRRVATTEAAGAPGLKHLPSRSQCERAEGPPEAVNTALAHICQEVEEGMYSWHPGLREFKIVLREDGKPRIDLSDEDDLILFGSPPWGKIDAERLQRERPLLRIEHYKIKDEHGKVSRRLATEPWRVCSCEGRAMAHGWPRQGRQRPRK
jgi:hypothetical protein